MPRNKRESLIYTVLMCFTMVLWMSIYNVTLHMGALNLTTIREAWIGFPIAYVFAMCMDWFVVSGPALLYDIDFTKQDVDEAYRKSLYDFANEHWIMDSDKSD